jgi:hybrid cluster-associated redox disulfide protein
MEMMTSDMTVEYILEKWPETAAVFNHDLKTACVGCPIAPFDTLADVARIYELDLSNVMALLQHASEQPKEEPFH